MDELNIDRRKLLLGATAIGTAALGTAALGAGARAQTNAATPAAAGAGGLPSRGEFVVRGATVLSMDDSVGDLPAGDVHVRDGEIVAVGENLSAPGATTIDGSGMICMPGIVETHFHLWTCSARPLANSNFPEKGYFPITGTLGPHYEPEDAYASVRLGLAEALAAGVTSFQNWAHNTRSPEHADAELRAMRDMGVRGRFAYGTPQKGPTDQPMDAADLARVQKEWITPDSLLTLGICSRNVASNNAQRAAISIEMAKEDWGAARKLGLPITMHTSTGSPVKMLDDAGLLGPDVQLVHPLMTSEEDRQILAARGVSYSTSPLGEAKRPKDRGEIQLGELLEAGVKVSMSIDVSADQNCDCFNCMRTLYALHKHRLPDMPLSTKRLVQLATIDGARDLGIDQKVGSLTPGKRADLILIRTTDPNMAPIGEPYDALVNFAAPGNVDTVIIDGRVLRQGGKYTAVDFMEIATKARESIFAVAKRANWS
jgi:cytosine/adenosine deaminase-related metal-dependent hydrolase